MANNYSSKYLELMLATPKGIAQFSGGFYTTEDPVEIKAIESSSLYGAYITKIEAKEVRPLTGAAKRVRDAGSKVRR